MSSSTSNSDSAWRRFFLVFVSAVITFIVGLYVLILVIDPYDALEFSPDFERTVLHTDRRLALPALARDSQFNSLVLGTSTSMLLSPSGLNGVAEAKFVNLAMPNASPWEQLEMLKLFGTHHQQAGYLLIGIDEVWCRPHGAEQFVAAGKSQPFPYRLYDDNPWNDFPKLSERTLRHARMQAAWLLRDNKGSPPRDGYFDFATKLYGTYDLARARANIHEDKKVQHFKTAQQLTKSELQSISQAPFPDIDQLKYALRKLPNGWRSLLFFTPYHVAHQPPGTIRSGAIWETCKSRVSTISEQLPGVTAIDFFIHSSITNVDNNYWDGQHYTKEVADILENTLASLLMESSDDAIPSRQHKNSRPL